MRLHNATENQKWYSALKDNTVENELENRELCLEEVGNKINIYLSIVSFTGLEL